MNKLLILSAMAFFVALMPIAPALACFPNADADEILFAPALRGRSSTTDDYETERVGEGAYGGRSFDRDPISMSFCELPEPGFVVVNGKCYDFDAITDFDTEEECQADPVCKAYREEQKQREEKEPEYDACGCPIMEGIACQQEACLAEDEDQEPIERTDDPNHGEIKGDEELGQDQEQDEEEHQEEEEQGQEESKETTGETNE